MRKYIVKYILTTKAGRKFKGKVKVKNCYSELHAKSKTEDHIKSRYKTDFGSIKITSVLSQDFEDLFKDITDNFK